MPNGPALYTVELQATFWKWNSFVWAVLAAMGEIFFEYFRATLEGGFFQVFEGKKTCI